MVPWWGVLCLLLGVWWMTYELSHPLVDREREPLVTIKPLTLSEKAGCWVVGTFAFLVCAAGYGMIRQARDDAYLAHCNAIIHQTDDAMEKLSQELKEAAANEQNSRDAIHEEWLESQADLHTRWEGAQHQLDAFVQYALEASDTLRRTEDILATDHPELAFRERLLRRVERLEQR